MLKHSSDKKPSGFCRQQKGLVAPKVKNHWLRRMVVRTLNNGAKSTLQDSWGVGGTHREDDF